MKQIGKLWFPDEEGHFTQWGDNVHDYQREQRDVAIKFVKDFSACIDVGAHVGIFSRHFQKYFGKVYAFEPMANLRECLLHNVDTDSVEIYPFALGDTARSATMVKLSTAHSGCSFIWDDERVFRPHVANPEIVPVEQRTIDSFEFESLGLIKIDVQGADHLVLLGATETLKRCKPVIMIEAKPVGGRGGPVEHILQTEALLRGLGYKLHGKVGADRVYWHP